MEALAKAPSAGSEGSMVAQVALLGGGGGDAAATAAAKLQLVQEIESRIKQAAEAVIGQAERQVAFMEQELMNVKEQALSMLLNLKHASDAQIHDLEKQVSVERKRAEEAEAKVTALQDSLKRLKADVRKSKTGGSREDEAAADSLFLIAGVACENAEAPQESKEQAPADVDMDHKAGAAYMEADDLDASTQESSSPSTDSEEEKRARRRRKRKSKPSKTAAGSKRTRGRSSSAAAAAESSRDSRRLMQGARQVTMFLPEFRALTQLPRRLLQLFSLAEKKWGR